MFRSAPSRAVLSAAACLLLAAAHPSAQAAPAGEPPPAPAAAGSAGATIEPLSPLTQSMPELFELTCFRFLLTNSGAVPDTVTLAALDVTPGWSVTVQNSVVTIPLGDPFDYSIAGETSDTLCVELVTFVEEVGSCDFEVSGLGGAEPLISYHLTLYAGVAAVGVEDLPRGEASARLLANRPNPFRRSTEIGYELARPARVDLRIHDAAGRLVRVLESATRSPGRHTARWDGTDDAGRPVAAGVYFCWMAAGETGAVRRMMVLR